ncbi:hypothetical protein ACUHMQ_19870 [Chitinimonas sp. PSY-7]|uniref:hypothetical protein n=1 Tax=Chitinimonas sp. PSY-7 TaxID=3459088 RepID=UPI00403FFCB2
MFCLTMGVSLSGLAATPVPPQPPQPPSPPEASGEHDHHDEREHTKRPPPLPPEVFTVCEGKQEGDRVSFVSRRGDVVEGRCKLMPAKLVMVPDGPPPRDPGKKDGPGAGHKEP